MLPKFLGFHYIVESVRMGSYKQFKWMTSVPLAAHHCQAVDIHVPLRAEHSWSLIFHPLAGYESALMSAHSRKKLL